jgi:flagellar biosynthesis/type III secretory pathway protein FliH
VSERLRIRLPSAPSRLRLHSAPASGPGSRGAVELQQLQARAAAHEASRAAVQALVAQMRDATGQLAAVVQGRLDEIGAQAAEFGLAVAREVIGAALGAGTSELAPVVGRCLRQCAREGERAVLVVRLSPSDLGPVLSALEAEPSLRESSQHARFVADPAIARGSVQVETGAGRLSYDPREVFERIAAAVRQELHGEAKP